MRALLEPMTHTEFRSILQDAIDRIYAAIADPSRRPSLWRDRLAHADRGYLRDAIAASERFDIDPETVEDALAIAAEY